jgi:acyl-CoA thioesterase-2
MWMRTREPLPDDALLQACALTYASDLGSGFGDGTVPDVPRGGPSIDHAVWFHDGLRMDDWVLLEMWPLKAGGGRGLYTGTMQDASGRVGAMLTQEVLFRRPGSEPLPPK